MVLTLVAVQLMATSLKRNWFTDIWRQIPVVVLALACFTTAQALHGSGYIAAFVGGLLFGYFAKGSHSPAGHGRRWHCGITGHADLAHSRGGSYRSVLGGHDPGCGHLLSVKPHGNSDATQ